MKEPFSYLFLHLLLDLVPVRFTQVLLDANQGLLVVSLMLLLNLSTAGLNFRQTILVDVRIFCGWNLSRTNNNPLYFCCTLGNFFKYECSSAPFQ